jgi:mannose-6-phosphate isomerase-like protein (cupin superfamily)
MLVRIYTGDDGQSHFEDIGMPSDDVLRVATKPGEDLVFRRSAENGFSDWHHPTRRQYLIVLEGQMEVICGDGSTRQFQPGDVLLAEDMTGQGHQTRAINGSYRSLSMGIPDLAS